MPKCVRGPAKSNWAKSQENLSSGLLTRLFAHIQKLARGLNLGLETIKITLSCQGKAKTLRSSFADLCLVVFLLLFFVCICKKLVFSR